MTRRTSGPSTYRIRLRCLLENLFRNAVDHGGKTVTFRIGTLGDSFFVDDDGSGIPEKKREKALEGGYSSQEEGTGLGLSITQGIAKAHGWSIVITEGRKGGARFEFRAAEGPAGRPILTAFLHAASACALRFCRRVLSAGPPDRRDQKVSHRFGSSHWAR